MEHGPFIDGLPIKNCDFPLNMVIYLLKMVIFHGELLVIARGDQVTWLRISCRSQVLVKVLKRKLSEHWQKGIGKAIGVDVGEICSGYSEDIYI
jgi:triphosphoribosyl-dephospho-CoA synthetase